MKYLRFITMILLCSFAAVSHSAAITNGDFATCDYTGWSKFIDLDPDSVPSASSDFEITPGNCAARMNVDRDDTFAFFVGNELSQLLDLTNPYSRLELSFDLTVDSELTSIDPSFVADFFVIALYDDNEETRGFYDETGEFGYLFEGDINGAASYSQNFALDSSFFNRKNISLVFQLQLGLVYDDILQDYVTDFGASSMTIDNVTLNAVNTPSMLLLVLASMTLVFRRSLKSMSLTKSFFNTKTQL